MFNQLQRGVMGDLLSVLKTRSHVTAAVADAEDEEFDGFTDEDWEDDEWEDEEDWEEEDWDEDEDDWDEEEWD